MKVSRLEEFLRGCSCFALLGDDELGVLLDGAEIRGYKLGEVVFRQGDPGDAMYLVYSGKMRVLREEDGREIPLNTLSRGDHFGELALVSREPRGATIRAADDSTLVAIPAEAVRNVLEHSGELRQYFDRYAERIELWNFIKLVGQLGSHLKVAQLRKLVDRFEERDFDDGTNILTAGQVPDRFYLIQAGRVKVTRGGKLQVTLTAGDTFGGGPLLNDPPGESPFTICAEGRIDTVALSAADFRQLLEDSPRVRSFFEERTAHYPVDEAEEHFATVSVQLTQQDIERIRAESEAGPVDLEPLDETPAEAEAAIPAVDIPAEESTLPSRPGGLAGWWKRCRFPFIPQHEQVDCGAASLAMITASYGRPVGVSRLRDLAGVGTDGATLAQLASAAEEVGYETRQLELSADGLDRLELPAVLFWRGYHYVVLYALTENSAYIADPAFGKVRISRDELVQQYSGFALKLTPTEATAEVRARASASGRLLSLLAQHKRVLFAILGTSLLLDLLGLAPPFFTQWIVDRVLVPDGQLSLLTMVATGLVLASATQIGMTALRSLVAVRLSQNLDRVLLHEFYAHLLRLPTQFFKLRRTGDIVARFDDNRNVRELFTAGTLTAVLDLLMVVVCFAVMFYWNWQLALVVLAFVPLFAVFTLLVSPVMKRQHRMMLEEEAAHESNLIESISGIDMIKAMAVERSVQNKWEGLFNQFLKTQYRSEKLEQLFGAIAGALGVLSNVALLWYGALLVMQETLSVGQYMAFSMLAGQVTGPLSGIMGLWDQLQQARVSLERMSDILDNDPEPQPDPNSRVYLEVIRGAIRFDNVFFRYASKQAPYVLRGVSFSVEPGQRIAIVGRSGSGKTTLVRLLLGLYRPTEGVITIDGYDLRRIDLETFRRQVGFVLQENLLFSGTIRENIALGDPAPDMQRVEEASTLAGAHEFISTMPLGYDTVVGEMGLTLSGGQRQRVSIARALYRRPQILIFDEATSALDSLSEREIQNNFDTMLADRTALIIAHKIATVRSADHILVLHDGAIVEQGTHDELIARRGTYYYLAAQQLNL